MEKSNQSSMKLRDLPSQFLEDITNGFSNERKLGSGGYGEVYKGVDKNGKVIAVKKLYHMAGLDDNQFNNELNNLSRVQHQNIIRLVGYCYEISHRPIDYNGEFIFAKVVKRVLCLEYLQCGSLDKHLYEESCGHDWHTRYKIIKGICEGLDYLHGGLKEPIFHLDLKPANILLDKNMMPKIADFGLSRLFGGTHTHITKYLIGTEYYVPPEYLMKRAISNKYDIFSLGVIIIQIMTGPNGYSKYGEMTPQKFIEIVHRNWSDRIGATPMYASLEEDCRQVKRCIEIAVNCVEADKDKRPTIRDIINDLKQNQTNGSSPSQEQAGAAKIGQWGGVGGNYSDTDLAPHRLESVTVGGGRGEVIYSLEFSYYDRHGNKHTAGPWGGYGPKGHGSNRYVINLGPSEIITEVHGTIGPFDIWPAGVIRSLTFITNTDSHGPFGEEEGAPFRVPVHSNGSIVGFFARAGWFVDALGVYVRSNQEIQAGLPKVGMWGGSGGEERDITVPPHRLKSVTICSSTVVDSLAFSYNDRGGHEHTAGPWGGTGGIAHKILLGPSEFLTEVRGTTGSFAHASGEVVTSITLTTNARSYGPYGDGKGTPFGIPVWNNGSIVGFFGRARSFVHAIGFYLNPEPRAMDQQLVRSHEGGLTKIGPWGTNGGNAWDIDVTVEPYHLESVTVNCDAVINSIEFSYIDRYGKEHTVGPWGRRRGKAYKFQFGPHECLHGVSGTLRPFGNLPNAVESLTFAASSGCFDPIGGRGGGTPFNARAEGDGCIVGFFGCGESCVEALGFYVHRY